MKRHRVAAGAVVLAIGLAVIAACAPLPAETTPRAIDREKVPDLFSTPTTTVAVSGEIGVVCFVSQPTDTETSGSKCTGVDLEDVNPRTLIDALAAGPDEQKINQGITSWVPRDTRLLDAVRAGDDATTLVINLSSEINSLSSPNNVVAYRQIVETLTNGINGLGVHAIRVEVDGKPTKIPTDKGLLTTADIDDFNESSFGSASTARGS
ncbi:MAG TPA: GerMN domain-containing protein [Acidimicrobiales bacterium]|nr:GerMN domain-containing protein [Acidimicrobiales bacterium]